MATIQLPPDFREFLRLLNSHQVEYLLIGGWAVGYYGYVRPTNDLDVWVALEPHNAERVAAVLKEFGFNVPEPIARIIPKGKSSHPDGCSARSSRNSYDSIGGEFW